MPPNSDIIVIRRADEEVAAKKGGVWKIAHADFMTAMMAFFLIMWLVNATDEEIKKSIANYFNPINLMAAPTAQRGLSDPLEDAPDQTSGEADGQTVGEQPQGPDTPGDAGQAMGGGNVEQGNERTMASAGLLEETDNSAFHDPYAELASAASDIAPDEPTSIDAPDSTLGVSGTQSLSDAMRDPFDPAYWQTVQSRQAQTLRPGRADAADVPPPDAVIDAGASSPRGETSDVGAQNVERIEVVAGAPASAQTDTTTPRAGQHASVGPRSVVAEAVLAAHTNDEQPGEASATPQGAAASTSALRAQAARDEIEDALDGVTADVEVTAGERAVLISLTDDNDISMFAIGSSQPTSNARDLFGRVGGVLAQREGSIVVRGHTDARPFRSGGSDNWMLSFQRAHATKTALVDSGVAEERFVRVEGLADREPRRPEDTLAAENRRIEILYEPAGGNGE